MDIQFGSPASFNYIWLVLIVAGTMGYAIVARRRAVRQFATANRVGSILPARNSRTLWVSSVLTLGALAALLMALSDVRWGKTWREVPQKGIEVVFALDVSRSMLAEDVAPNRLGRAKQQIKDMVDEMTGDRVGLVVFAGDAKREIPLTSHYHDFKQALDEVGPHDVTHGGSNLGDAVRVASNSFLAKTSDHKAIVLITDGEDHESDPIQAAKRAHEERGIRVFTIGLGDEQQGAHVPANSTASRRDYLQHDGQQVWSKLDGQVLKAMALASGGAYIPAGMKQVDMSQVYRNYVAQVEQQDFETARIKGYIPRFQWFLGLALILCLIESLLGRRPCKTTALASVVPTSTTTMKPIRRRRTLPTAAAVAVTALCLGNAGELKAAEPKTFELADQAGRSMESGEFEKAAAEYLEAAASAPDIQELKYNQAVALYRNGELDAARGLFTSATASSNRELEAKARFNLGNCDYGDALKLAPEDQDAAKAKARSAISHYRRALAANSSDGDARANIELAGLLIRQLEQQEEQEKQQQQGQQPQDQKQNNEDSESQDQSNGGSSQEDQNENETSSSDGSSGESSEEPKNSESGEKDESSAQDGAQAGKPEDAKKEGSESNESNETTGESGEQDSDSVEEDSESKSEKRQSQGDPSDTDEDRERPEQESGSSDAHEDPSGPSEPQDSQNRSGSQGRDRENLAKQKNESSHEQEQSPEASEDANDQANSSPPNGNLQAADGSEEREAKLAAAELAEGDAGKPMTREEAMKMLQSVRDRDLIRRLQNSRKAQRRYIPGNKDW